MPYDRKVARIWVEKAREKVCSIREASITSGIPYATTHTLGLFTTRNLSIAVRMAPNVQWIPKKKLVSVVKCCCTWLNDRGVGVSKHDLLRAAKSLIEQRGGSFGTKTGLPSTNGFIHRARQRGDRLSLRKPVGLSRVRANGASPEAVSIFFRKLCEIVEEPPVMLQLNESHLFFDCK